jgi:hypothetical protein
MMAGTALPAAPSGFFNIIPMMTVPFQKTVVDRGRMTRIFRGVAGCSRLMRMDALFDAGDPALSMSDVAHEPQHGPQPGVPET